MKKYRLKKDLPTFKKGDIFTLSDGNLYKDIGEKIPEKPKTVWDLEKHSICWIIGNGAVYWDAWGNVVFGVEKRAVGNIFLTKKEAEKELARRKAKQILLKDTKGFKPSAGHYFYYVYYNYNSRELRVDRHTGTNAYGLLAFATQADAEASIKAHPDEWKNYFGIDEDDR